MGETSDQQLARRRQALAKRYGQQDERRPGGMLTAEREREVAVAQAVEKAHRHGISAPHSHELTELLSTITPEQQIPPALCNAVASLMVWLQQLEAEHAERDDDASKR